MLSQQIQSFLAERLDASHKRGLVNSKHYETLQPMFEKISAVAVYCMEKGMSVEEALNAAGHGGMRAKYAGRDASASTATGFASKHIEQQQKLVSDALGLEKKPASKPRSKKKA